MTKHRICKHIEDADRLEVIEIKKITADYIYYKCDLCRAEGRVKLPAYLNKWEYWRILQILRDANREAKSTANKCFIDNLMKICDHLYDGVPIETVKFASLFESLNTEEHINEMSEKG